MMPNRSTISFCALLLAVSPTNLAPQPNLQPTPLEAFAQLPTTHIVWSKEAGRLDSGDAHVVVTGLILEDTAQPPDRMRGIRIDLRNQKSEDQVYLGEETLAAYRDALDEISRFSKETKRQDDPGGTHYLGACLFWYGNKVPRVHALNVADYLAPDSSGLSISAFKNAEYRFPGQDAGQLSLTISKAIEQLKSR